MNVKRYEKSSGNVFKDLGLPDAEEHLVKAKLVWKINGIIKERGLKQVEVAALLVFAARCFKICFAGNFGNSRWSACCGSCGQPSVKMWKS